MPGKTVRRVCEGEAANAEGQAPSAPRTAGPSLTWANRITVSRIVLVAPFAVCLLNLREPGWETISRRTALAVMAVMAASDLLDGLLARRLRQETPLGRFLDPVADKLLVVCAVVLLGHAETSVPGYVLPSVVLVAAIGKDVLVVVGFCLIYLITARVCIVPRRLGKVCTVVQLGMVAAVLLGPDLPASVRWVPRAIWWVASGLAAAAAVDYFRFGQRFVASVAQARA